MGEKHSLFLSAFGLSTELNAAQSISKRLDERALTYLLPLMSEIGLIGLIDKNIFQSIFKALLSTKSAKKIDRSCMLSGGLFSHIWIEISFSFQDLLPILIDSFNTLKNLEFQWNVIVLCEIKPWFTVNRKF